jgi:hypothetical protein
MGKHRFAVSVPASMAPCSTARIVGIYDFGGNSTAGAPITGVALGTTTKVEYPGGRLGVSFGQYS